MPAGQWISLFGHPKLRLGVSKACPRPALNGRKASTTPAASGLGGSSLMNGMIYIRGNPTDYDRWRQMGFARMVLCRRTPVFQALRLVQPHRAGDSPYHGTAWSAETDAPLETLDRINEIFVEACTAGRCPVLNEDFNGEPATRHRAFRCKGFWRPHVSQPIETYLRNKWPPNLTVHHRLPFVHGHRDWQGTRATGVLKLVYWKSYPG